MQRWIVVGVLGVLAACGGDPHRCAPADSCRASCAFGAGDPPSVTLADFSRLGTRIPIDTFVLVMQENRTFDHLFSSLTVPGQADMQLTGNLTGHDFTMQRGGSTVATVSRKWVSMTATYGVDVADGENDLIALCVVLALEAEQQRGRGSGGISFGSS